MAAKEMAKKGKRAMSKAAGKPRLARKAPKRGVPRLRGAALQTHATLLLDRLLAEYPDARCALDFS